MSIYINKSTQCVHSGSVIDEVTKGIVTPLQMSTAFDYVDIDDKAYPRYFNTPNQKVVAEKIAALENGEEALVFSSGLAAVSAILFSILEKGDHAIFQNDLYGGTHNAIAKELSRFGIDFTFVDSMDATQYEQHITNKTKLIYIETPSNPLLKIIDIKAIADLCKSRKLISIIDNTFASPINQNPIDLGMDVVMHSATKYLGGHSDICCGVAISNKEFIANLWKTAINHGGSLNAQMCALLERSLKTLSIRVKQQNLNAQQLAEFLNGHKKIKHVFYPGLKQHPDHELAKKQMMGFGGMLSFDLDGDPDKYVKRLKIIKPAMSLGGVESTVSSPAQTSHAKIGAEGRAKVGISDALLRLSVGIEDIEDLIKDLDQAF